MDMPIEVTEWAPYYVALHERGYSDGAIGDMAGVSRFVINRVRLGRYQHDKHELGYNGGVRVIRALNALEKEHG